MNEKDKNEISGIVQKSVIDAMNGFIGKFIAFFSVIVVVFLFIIGGSFTYTSRVSNDVKDIEVKCQEYQKDADQTRQDIGTISGKLTEEYPESIILDDIHNRNITNRGNAQDH